MLENKYVPSPHTSNIIANELHKCIETWNLGNQVTSITMDNGSNMDAITQLQADLFTSTDREIKKDENRLKRLLLTNDEWELLDQLVDLLMPFEEATPTEVLSNNDDFLNEYTIFGSKALEIQQTDFNDDEVINNITKKKISIKNPLNTMMTDEKQRIVQKLRSELGGVETSTSEPLNNPSTPLNA
ncbi:hypothetical protein RirG_056860 [Rhizophagus irregularis DAOM 197198w]|uniref:Uncharacterized protein n=1 Tax=Rhizophagus irregularis (strain DAOM 197198w) TaxID=1432141 RepID=A0A015N3Y1_RHIIW|nr:hypothetical protein RirG_056860 [Rhizophagus irregularis DAOM 197198w]